jgi:hypothetical protein
MTPGHPTFNKGHCFMAVPLNRPEVEYLGPILIEDLKRLEQKLHVFRPDCKDEDVLDMRLEVKMITAILEKMDYPFRNKP